MAARDLIAIFVAFIFVAAIAIFFISYIGSRAIVAVRQVDAINDTPRFTAAIQVTEQKVIPKFDYLILMILFALVIGDIILSWIFGGNPIFMFLYIIVYILALFISPIFANVWSTMTTVSQFNQTLAIFPVTNHIIGYLPQYVAIIGLIGMLVMFGKPYLEAGTR